MHTLIYRYRLRPSDHQKVIIEDTARRLRNVWNGLVAATRWAEHECQHGRKATVVRKLSALISAKKVMGVRALRVKEISITQGCSLEEANRLFTTEQVNKDSQTILRRNGSRSKRASIRLLALRYAIETVSAHSDGFGVESKAFWGVIARFRDSTSLYRMGKRGAPRFKRSFDTVTMQFQVQGWNPRYAKDKIRLYPLFGKSCSSVRFVEHRELPSSAIVKQVAVIGSGDNLHVVIFADVPDEVAMKQFPNCNGTVAGIDPGRKTAASLSSTDGTVQERVTPPILRDRRMLRKLARLERKLDRQRRAANPSNYTEQGVAKRNQKWRRSPSMQSTQEEANAIRRRVKNTRTEHYRLEARSILSRFDHVGVGNWRPNATRSSVARRASNRKDSDNAIGQLTAILRDYAGRSKNPKAIYDVNEAGTTRRCVKCDAETGPTGLTGLRLREWTCGACGTHHDRDFSSAQAIALRTAKLVAVTHTVNDGSASGQSKTQPARRAARRGKRSGAAAMSPKVPVEQEAKAVRLRVSKVGARVDETMMDQTTEGACSHAASADEASMMLALEPTIAVPRDEHHQHSCADDSEAWTLAPSVLQRTAGLTANAAVSCVLGRKLQGWKAAATCVLGKQKATPSEWPLKC